MDKISLKILMDCMNETARVVETNSDSVLQRQSEYRMLMDALHDLSILLDGYLDEEVQGF